MAHFTGTITRIAFFRRTRVADTELVVEVTGSDMRTFTVQGNGAVLLCSFLIIGKTYTVDYTPMSGGEYDGEIHSAIDRN